MFYRATLLLAALALHPACELAAQGLPPASPLVALSSAAECNQCTGTLLKGRHEVHPEARWGMISDLPESFKDYGVLYSTRDSLPANGGAPELLRQRRSDGFTTIDGSFDVFIFHLIIKAREQAARIVVQVTNKGDKPVTIRPKQVIKTEGIIGTVHEFESEIARRVLDGDWDSPLSSVIIPPGQGRVIAYGKRFGNIDNGPDASRNVNCFGYVRATVEGGQADLQVDVVAIPPVDLPAIAGETSNWLTKGAQSTDEVPMDSEPSGCGLRRAVGVYPNTIWRNDEMVIDVSKLSADAPIGFPIALPDVQTSGCPDARQSSNLVLRPGYTRHDTIGNYMREYDVRLTLINTDEVAREAVIGFRKDGADIGLAYMINDNARPEASTADTYRGLNSQSLWAGPKQSAREKPFVPTPYILEPGTQRTVATRFLIVGNSSLPFFLTVGPGSAEPGAQTPH